MTLIVDPRQPRQLEWVVSSLRGGAPIALPSETVYGLAGLALDEKSLARIFALKARPHFDPLIVHVIGRDAIEPLVQKITPLHALLMKMFWPGPLTLLFEKSSAVPDLCTAASPWVAVRAPSHPDFRKVLGALGQPLAAPRANRFGRISPTAAEHVVEELGPFGLEGVVDGGPCEWGLESTVVKVVSSNEIEIVRRGSLSEERLQSVVGPEVAISVRESGSGSQMSEAPGQLASHYAPRTPLKFYQELPADEIENPADCALLSVFGVPEGWRSLPWKVCVELSKSGSDVEAAARLFQTLRDLDAVGCRQIVALGVGPEKMGLIPAIYDRLKRAQAR